MGWAEVNSGAANGKKRRGECEERNMGATTELFEESGGVRVECHKLHVQCIHACRSNRHGAPMQRELTEREECKSYACCLVGLLA